MPFYIFPKSFSLSQTKVCACSVAVNVIQDYLFICTCKKAEFKLTSFPNPQILKFLTDFCIQCSKNIPTCHRFWSGMLFTVWILQQIITKSTTQLNEILKHGNCNIFNQGLHTLHLLSLYPSKIVQNNVMRYNRFYAYFKNRNWGMSRLTNLPNVMG